MDEVSAHRLHFSLWLATGTKKFVCFYRQKQANQQQHKKALS
jgi:hypothetical protein